MTCAVASAEDVVLKKMLYLFISTYAQANPDLTLLTINLLTKDCRDQDPTIRGLALRSLCQLRVANLIEYLVRLPHVCLCLVGARASLIFGNRALFSRTAARLLCVLSLQLTQNPAVLGRAGAWQSIAATLDGVNRRAQEKESAQPSPGTFRGLTPSGLWPAAQMSPIQQGLKDAHPYVRRTAVMSVLKVYHLDSAAVLNAGALAQPRSSTSDAQLWCMTKGSLSDW